MIEIVQFHLKTEVEVLPPDEHIHYYFLKTIMYVRTYVCTYVIIYYKQEQIIN